MAWIRVNAQSLDMKVVRRCADALGVPRAHALGLLTALWSWMSKWSDDGVVSAVADHEIEEYAGWSGTPGRFAHFVKTKHTDQRGRIREWDEYMGRLVETRRKDRERKAEMRALLNAAQDKEVDERLGRIPLAPRGERCAYCGEQEAQVWDHVVPVSRGGRHEKRNIVPACRDCARSKGDLPVTEFLATIGVVSPESWGTKHGVVSAVEQAREQTRSLDVENSVELVEKPPERIRVGHLSVGQIQSSNGQTHLSNGKIPYVKNLSTDLTAPVQSLTNESERTSALLTSKPEVLQAVQDFTGTFYRNATDDRFDSVLAQLANTLSPAGQALRRGVFVKTTPRVLVAALRETIASPPNDHDKAIVFVLKKLYEGNVNVVTAADGVTPRTEAISAETKKLDAEVSPVVRQVMAEAEANKTKTIPPTAAALKWAITAPGVSKQVTAAVKERLAGWPEGRAREQAADKLFSEEVVRRWQAAGSPGAAKDAPREVQGGKDRPDDLRATGT